MRHCYRNKYNRKIQQCCTIDAEYFLMQNLFQLEDIGEMGNEVDADE